MTWIPTKRNVFIKSHVKTPGHGNISLVSTLQWHNFPSYPPLVCFLVQRLVTPLTREAVGHIPLLMRTFHPQHKSLGEPARRLVSKREKTTCYKNAKAFKHEWYSSSPRTLLANFANKHDKRVELNTSAFRFLVQLTHDKINSGENFEITNENGEINTKNESQFFTSSIAATQLTDILST